MLRAILSDSKTDKRNKLILSEEEDEG